jgi:hypothetical protein
LSRNKVLKPLLGAKKINGGIKMKKRIALFLVAALLSVGLIISCGGGGKDDPDNPDGPGGPGTQVQYTVSFDTAGGTPATIAPVKVNAGSGVGAGKWPDDPSKDEHQFNGWFEGSVKYEYSTPITKDVTLVAQYSLRPALDLGGFTTFMGNRWQRGWATKGLDLGDDLTVDDIKDAKYLVLHTKGGVGTNWGSGFEPISVFLQSNASGITDSWGTGDNDRTDITAATVTRSADKDIFIVIALPKVKRYAEKIGGSQVKFTLSYNANSNHMNVGLGLEAAYLYFQNIAENPTGAVELTSTGIDGIGFITEENIFGIDVPTNFWDVTFDLAEGEVSFGTAMPEVKVGAGKSLGVKFPAKDMGWVEREGYNFVGWKNGASDVTASTPIDSDVELTAVWVKGFDFPDITNAVKLTPPMGVEWNITSLYPLRYVIVASVGGGSDTYLSTGYWGFQFGFTGTKADNSEFPYQQVTAGDSTSFAHTETEIVYFIVDLKSTFSNFAALGDNPNFVQFRINYGEKRFGQYQVYAVDGTIKSMEKPANAADWADYSSTATIVGFITNIEDVSTLFSTEDPFVSVTSVTYSGKNPAVVGDIPLTAAILPGDASVKTVTWEIISAGTTGASLSGSTLTTTAEGTVQVKGTIANAVSSDGGTTFTNIDTGTVSIVVNPAAGFPNIDNATKLDHDGDGQWAINGLGSIKYFIIAATGLGNRYGVGGIQLQLQGAGYQPDDDSNILTTGDWTSFNNDEDEIVYLFFDLTGWEDGYDTLLGPDSTASWVQLRINQGIGDVLAGEYQGYYVDASVDSLTKPSGAVDFAGGDSEDHGPVTGFVAKGLPNELLP